MLRSWQKYFIEETLKELREGSRVVAINSPTGSGKTLTALKIAESVLDGGLAKKVYFVVRTVTQEILPIKDSKKFNLNLRIVPLVGKDKACPLGSTNVNLCPHCPWRKRPAAPPKEFGDLFDWIRASFKELRCAYITLKELSKDADLVSLTYAHLNPNVAEKIGIELEDSIFIFDEAHYITKAIRERKAKLLWVLGVMNQYPKFVQSLSKHEKFRERSEELASLMHVVKDVIYVLKSLTSYKGINAPIRVKDAFHSLPRELDDVKKVIDDVLPELIFSGESIADLGVKIRDIIELLLMASSVNTGVYFDGENLVVKDLIPWIKHYVASSSGAVLLSGTMPRKSFLEKLLQKEVKYLSLFEREELRRDYFNLFDPKNVLFLFITDYSSKFKVRTDPLMLERREHIEEACANFVSDRGGLGLLVYPSYNALTLAKPHLEALRARVNIIISERGMGPYIIKEAEKIDAGLLAVVAGDQLTEGVELVDDEGRSRLSLVAVIGAPYPAPSPFLEDFSRALDPSDPKAMADLLMTEEMLTRTKQAIGRLVRSPADKGLIILADSRFMEYEEDLAKFWPRRRVTARELLEASAT